MPPTRRPRPRGRRCRVCRWVRLFRGDGRIPLRPRDQRRDSPHGRRRPGDRARGREDSCPRREVVLRPAPGVSPGSDADGHVLAGGVALREGVEGPRGQAGQVSRSSSRTTASRAPTPGATSSSCPGKSGRAGRFGSRSATGNSRSSSREEKPACPLGRGDVPSAASPAGGGAIPGGGAPRRGAAHPALLLGRHADGDRGGSAGEPRLRAARHRGEAEGRVRPLGRLEPPDLPAPVQGRARAGGRADGRLSRGSGAPRGRAEHVLPRRGQARPGPPSDRRGPRGAGREHRGEPPARRDAPRERAPLLREREPGRLRVRAPRHRGALGPGEELPRPLEGLHSPR